MTEIHYEYHRPGKALTVFRQRLVLDRPDVKVLLSQEYQGPDIEIDNVVVHHAGAPIVWFVFPERWHDIGRFHLSDERFTGWYTNLLKPVEIRGNTWMGHDLFLDLWQPVGGGASWLDEDELDEATHAGVIDPATRKRVLNERALIDYQLQAGNWPPPIAQDIDLPLARELTARASE